MIRTLATGILSTLIFPAMLSCEKLPDPVQPDQPKQEKNEKQENNGNDNSGETDTTILYSSNQIVQFYGSNTWSYTRIGKMQYESLDELKSFLKAGEGKISVTLSL